MNRVKKGETTSDFIEEKREEEGQTFERRLKYHYYYERSFQRNSHDRELNGSKLKRNGDRLSNRQDGAS